MVWNTLILSANSVVLSLSGSASEILISVTLAIKGWEEMKIMHAQVTTKKKDALLKLTISLVEKNSPLVVGFVEAP